jgi:hypothetical protein
MNVLKNQFKFSFQMNRETIYNLGIELFLHHNKLY